jgi:SOS response regulatory protein OraA/RecX
LKDLDRQAFLRKLVEYLARRGFSYEVAQETAQRLWTETVSDG